ncbi:MAG: Polysaccharide biosynthesis protein [Candidatus Woesebacteria bacterium GW2011_GWB1_40_101]|uniref:Polysaccharide biosynthesis protein n=1 Tax=Candidatus Woesebacteria bacterium GW2011_GWB1_40_101 TaxID=1618575 RepID=A0A0G0QQZ4_9BACT|nr:MAG: Polysaccharide biosynthesis protein [Candidatus Woesebacteria bacterium GW2011_GWB1_40_101]
MKQHIDRIRGWATSATAKDTYILFAGNVISAFFAFLFTLFVSRSLSVSEFGIFSAAANLIVIISSLSDLGISSGIVNFVAKHLAKGKRETSEKYIKAAFLLKFVITFILVVLVGVFAPFVSKAYWVAGISIGIFLWGFFPNILQAQKRFLASVIVDLSLVIPRAILGFALLLMGVLTLDNALLTFFVSFVFVVIVGFKLVGVSFLKTRPEKKIYMDVLKFSGWLGVNRFISGISGRLDIQMLAVLVGATSTGLYSIPARLASFVVVLVSSFSAVLAPRLAAFDDREKEKTYIAKAVLASLAVVVGIVLWIIIAKPFILILFGEKYLGAVPIFQALTASMIPFVFTIPSVTAIIYSMKKPIYIGVFSFFQLAAIFVLNLVFIPKYGVFGPTLTFAITNSILAAYSWIIVIRHYWFKP